MEILARAWESVSISAIVQIAILTVVIYAILKAARGTRFGQALMGVGIIAALMFTFTYVLQFDVLSTIVQALLVYMAISTVVIFQPEIRRFLSQIGAFGTFERAKHDPDGTPTPDYFVETLRALARRKMGALVAFERGISLRSYEDSGVVLDATFSQELVTTLFTPPLPLHDGGVTIRNGRLAAAHCVFPISNNPNLIGSGMRHRAAVGLSEETDSLVFVVSEERGAISVAHNGKLTRCGDGVNDPTLLRWATKALRHANGGNRSLVDLLPRFMKTRLAKGKARP